MVETGGSVSRPSPSALAQVAGRGIFRALGPTEEEGPNPFAGMTDATSNTNTTLGRDSYVGGDLLDNALDQELGLPTDLGMEQPAPRHSSRRPQQDVLAQIHTRASRTRELPTLAARRTIGAPQASVTSQVAPTMNFSSLAPSINYNDLDVAARRPIINPEDASTGSSVAKSGRHINFYLD